MLFYVVRKLKKMKIKNMRRVLLSSFDACCLAGWIFSPGWLRR